MNKILITNESFYDKVYLETFVKQEKYKFFSVNNGSSTLVPMYKELLKPILGELINQSIKDNPLTTEQTTAIKIIFEKQLDETIPKRIKTDWPPNRIIEYKGQTYKLDLRLPNPIDRRIEDFFYIVNMADECLKDNKPMYISIEQ